MVIGLTGSIGTGKSTVSHYLSSKGYIVLDADQFSHDALNKDTPTYQDIISLFDCLNNNGEIDRKKLSSIIFNDVHKRKQLESIIHPYVIKKIKEGIKNNKIVFLDVPLLFESQIDTLCDKILVIYCDEEIQVNRIIERDHCSKEDALKRIHSQMSQKEKIKKADYSIANNEDVSSLLEEVERFLNHEVIHI